MIMITDPGIVTQTHRRGAAPGPGRLAVRPARATWSHGVSESFKPLSGSSGSLCQATGTT